MKREGYSRNSESGEHFCATASRSAFGYGLVVYMATAVGAGMVMALDISLRQGGITRCGGVNRATRL